MAVSLDKQPLLVNGEEPEEDYLYYKDDADDDDSQLRGIAEADYFPIDADEILLTKGALSLSLSFSLFLSLPLPSYSSLYCFRVYCRYKLYCLSNPAKNQHTVFDLVH